MQSVAKIAGYHATMLLEPMTDFAITETARAAFIRNVRNRVTDIETVSSLMFAEADVLGVKSSCLGDFDLNPTADTDLFSVLDRLLALIPVGANIAYNSAAYVDLLNEVRCELHYLWRQRLEGVRMTKMQTVCA